MIPQTIPLPGQRLDLEVWPGASLGPFIFAIKNPDGSPTDLTGSVLVGTAAGTIPWNVSVNTPASGQATAWLTPTQTTKLPAGMALPWHLSITWSDGSVVTLFYGVLKIIGAGT